MKENIEERINDYLRKGLATCKLPFTYDDVELVKSRYDDDKHYEIETVFRNYNGTNIDHKHVLNCYDGKKTQIMFQFSGFPGASINFDRELLPDEGIDFIVKAGEFEQRKKDLSEDIKKASI